MFLIAIMWTLEYVEQDSFINENYSIPHDSLKSIRITIARIVIGAALIAGTIGWSMGPLCIRLDVTKPEVTGAVDSSPNNTKTSAKSPSSSSQSPSPTTSPTSSPTPSPAPSSAPANSQGTLNIIGYRNAYGSTYFLFVINVLAAVLLVNKPLGGISLFLLTNQILTFFELVDLLDIRSNLISVVVMGLLGYSHFFTTGHQATLAAIHWETGFLLTETILFPITHIAIILETFGSFIIIYLSIPLLTLWKIPPNNKPIALISKIVENATSLMIYQLCLTLSTLIMTAHFRRHLMVWKIFAPRFMLNAMLVILMNIIVTFISVGFVSSRVIKHWYQIFGM
ncbi:unnamed protein product [[Candida] boidinii]|nr:unnamed protein product [[Candida] boidinii]